MIDLPELLVPDAAAWLDWLAEHHADSAGVWLVPHNVGGLTTALTYAQALDEALCYGWIDGQVARRDEGSHLERFTPRRSRSPWSARNVGHDAKRAETRARRIADLVSMLARGETPHPQKKRPLR